MTESLLSKIRARMLELMIVSGLPRAEALKLATKQFGRVELLKSDSGAVPTNPEPTTNDASNAKEQFFARIMSMRSRMFPGAKPEADLSERLLGAETRKK